MNRLQPDQTQQSARVNWGPLLLAAGYLLIGLALLSGSRGPTAEFTGAPRCDGQPMSRGDTCITYVPRRANSTVQTFDYDELLARQQLAAKEGPWTLGMYVGSAGVILVFVGAGRHLTIRKRPSRSGVRGFMLLAAGGPLLVGAALVGVLELRYDREYREQAYVLWPNSTVPEYPLLMVALILVAAAITFAVLRGQYRKDPEYAHVYPAPPDPEAASGHAERLPDLPVTLPTPPLSPANTAAPAAQPVPPWTVPPPRPTPAPAGEAVAAPAAAPADVPGRSGGLVLIHLLLAIGVTVFIGISSQWHLGVVLVVLIGAVVGAFMGIEDDQAPASQLTVQLVSLALMLTAAGATYWLGVLSDWHGWVILLVWSAAVLTNSSCSTLVEDLSQATASGANRAPLAIPVPWALMLLGVLATGWIGEASGWQFLVLLALWATVATATVSYALTASPRQPTADARLTGRLLLAGLSPVGLFAVATVATSFAGSRIDWHLGLILPIWAGMIIALLSAAVVKGKSRPPAPATADEAQPGNA